MTSTLSPSAATSAASSIAAAALRAHHVTLMTIFLPEFVPQLAVGCGCLREGRRCSKHRSGARCPGGGRGHARGVPDTVHHQQGGGSHIHAVSVCQHLPLRGAAATAIRHGRRAALTVWPACAGRHFSQEHAPLPVNECLRLASTFHSMHAIAGNLTPVPRTVPRVGCAPLPARPRPRPFVHRAHAHARACIASHARVCDRMRPRGN